MDPGREVNPHRWIRFIDGEDWPYYAACKAIGIKTFFVEGRDGGPESYRPALKWCAVCPVSTDCLEDALLRHERFGVWGGKTPNQRTAILRARRTIALTTELD